jgi:hypothetical protein
MVCINITSVGKPELAEKFKAAVEGKTFMQFRVTLCPMGGLLAVNVETDYTDDEGEATGMLLAVLFDAIR